MTVHLVNPSHLSFGVGVITPRWLYVLAGATPKAHGDPRLTDETLEPIDPDAIQPGDVVGIGIHTANALRGYEIGKMARERGAYVIFGGIHSTLFPEEAHQLGGAHAVVKGDGDIVWAQVLADASRAPDSRSMRRPGRGQQFVPARWDLVPEAATCGRPCRPFAAVRSTVRSVRSGAPMASALASAPPTWSSKRWCSCGVSDFGFIALADDNFYPVTLTDLAWRTRNKRTMLKQLRRCARNGSNSWSAWRSFRTTWFSSPRSPWRRPKIQSFSTR